MSKPPKFNLKLLFKTSNLIINSEKAPDTISELLLYPKTFQIFYKILQLVPVIFNCFNML